ncbi:MAG TPA: FAD-dependent monooxygenase [Roseiarcus sp.]|nr:FAD-dependent monooxygenase [Roseiarcus sp.]
MSRRAIISGGGIGGLATALALSQAGFDITLYEQAGALEEFGAGLQLTPNATRILSRLGVLESVRAASTIPVAICALRGSDDAVLMRMTLEDAERRWGAPYLALHRADLQRALADAAERRSNVRLQLGSTVAGAAANGDRISVGLMRGAATIKDEADLLIGADGLRSRVRERLGLGDADKAAFTGRVAFRATVDSNLVDSRWRRPEVFLRLGPNAHLVHYPLRGGSVVNLVAVIEAAWRSADDDHPWGGEADRPALERAFARWSGSTRKLVATEANWRAWPLFGRPPVATFSLGSIALVGDAAHPMVPFLAQGAAQAVEDAGALGRALSQTSAIPEALSAYSRSRVARATRVQVEALKQGRIYHLSGPAAFARDVAMRLMGPQRLKARYDWLYGT